MDQSSPPNSRLMQVKVLYTFNDENKSNCLARCQQPLQIQTAQLDASTEVGIIELRTCIQAIVSASPELVAQLGQDYTIYAYDYSEYETPLVGQGMLSWVLASASTTPSAPAHQSKTMVTGRVTTNTLGLFSEGIKETLEVKLRLVPVPTCLQSEYLASMEKYRSSSTVVGQPSFDTAAWSTFLQANPSFGAPDPTPISAHIDGPQPRHIASNLLVPHHSLQTDSTNFDPNFHTLNVARPNQHTAAGSCSTTPSRSRSQQAESKKNPPSRPSSRASGRGSKRNSKHHSQTVDTSEAEDVPVRKRARVTKTDWNGGSTFGHNTESLRVTAATAASIRGNRPASAHPSAADIAAAEPAARPPTPRPQAAPRRTKPVSLARSTTGIAHEILVNDSSNQDSPYLPERTASPGSSPEKLDDSSASTPFDIPSSPPVFADPSPAPSSPQLPVLPLHDDSGFMSGNFDEDYYDDGKNPLDTEDLLVTARNKSELIGPQSDLPSSEFVSLNRPRLHPRSFSAPQQDLPRSRSEKFVALSEKGTSLAHASLTSEELEGLPIEHNSESVRRPASESGDRNARTIADITVALNTGGFSLLHATSIEDDPMRLRSESCAIEATSAAGSPAALPDVKLDVKPPLKGRQNSLMHEKKKQSVQDHLANAIKTGQMPRYCRNCGEISTPTWRKAFVKTVEGTPDPTELAEGENGLLTWETIEKDENGKVTSYRIIKKFTTRDETGYEGIDLCNSCGVWLFKRRCMRPPETWKKQDGPKPPPKERKKPSKKEDAESKPDEAQSDTKEEEESPNSAEREEDARVDSEALTHQDSNESTEVVRFKKPRVERASSTTSHERQQRASDSLGPHDAMEALKRAIQSSPPRFPGSHFTPINVDKGSGSSTKPTRRLLFPSPRKPGEVKILGELVESPPGTQKFSKDKENRNPADDSDDEIEHLFNNTDSVKTKKRDASTGDPLQTPLGPGNLSAKRRLMLSSASKRGLQSNPATPSRAVNSEFSLDPEQMTPFTRQLTHLISEANQSSDGLDANFGSIDGGMFAFSDFSMDDSGALIDFGPASSSSTLFGMYDNHAASSDGLWSSEEMNKTIDAFLQQGQDAGNDSNGESLKVVDNV